MNDAVLNKTPSIRLAFLNIVESERCCEKAREELGVNWDWCEMWINQSIAELEAAKAKIKEHRQNLHSLKGRE